MIASSMTGISSSALMCLPTIHKIFRAIRKNDTEAARGAMREQQMIAQKARSEELVENFAAANNNDSANKKGTVKNNGSDEHAAMKKGEPKKGEPKKAQPKKTAKKNPAKI